MTGRLLLAALLAATRWAVAAPALAAELPRGVVPVFVGDSPRAEWPSGDWTAVRVGDLAPRPADVGYLDELTLRGRLDGDTLRGEATLRVRTTHDRPHLVPLGESNLALWTDLGEEPPEPSDDAVEAPEDETEETDAAGPAAWPVLGRDGRGRTAVLLHSAGTHRLVAGWAAEGLPLYQQRRFRLTLPPAVATRIDLSLPSELEVYATDALVRKQPPQDSADRRETRWTLRPQRPAVVEFAIGPRTDRRAVRPTVRIGVLARIDQSGMSWRADLTVREPGGGPEADRTFAGSSIDVELPEGCLVDAVEVAGVSQPVRAVELDARVVVPIRVPTLPTVVRIEGRRLSGGDVRRIPQPVVRRGRLVAADVRVECDPLLVIRRYDATQLRQVAASLGSGRGDWMRFTAAGPRPRLAVTVGPPRAELTADLLSVVEFDPLAVRVRSLVAVSAQAGSATRVRVGLPTGWDWVDIAAQIGPDVLDWRLIDDPDGATGPIAEIELTSPISPRRGVTLAIRGVRAGGRTMSLPPPLATPQAATVLSRTLVLLDATDTTDATTLLTDGSPVPPLSVAELEASPLAGSLTAETAAAAAGTMQAFDLTGLPASELIRRSDEEPSPARRRETSSGRSGLATLALETTLGDVGDPTHLHEASYVLLGDAASQTPRVRLPPDADLISVELDGRPVGTLPAGSGDLRILSAADASSDRPPRTLLVRYETPRQAGWLASSDAIGLPTLSVPVVSFDWTITRADSIAITRPPQAAKGQTLPLATDGLDRLGWRRRLFGPLAREAGQIASPRSLIDAVFGQPGNEAASSRPPIRVQSVAPSEAYVLDRWDRRRASGLAAFGLIATFVIGVLLRWFRLSHRKRAASLWAPLCFAVAWFGPDAAAAAFGAAGTGTLLSLLVPRALVTRPRGPVPGDPDDGSTSVVRLPAGLLSGIGSVAVACGGFVWVSNAAAQPSAAIDFEQTEPDGDPIRVLVPVDDAAGLAAMDEDATVFIERSAAADLLRTVSESDLLITSLRVAIGTDDARQQARMIWRLRAGPRCRGVWLPLERGVTVVGEAERDGQSLSPIPAVGGDLFLPLRSDGPRETELNPNEAEDWSEHVLRLTLRLTPADATGFASLPLKRIGDVAVRSPFDILPRPIDAPPVDEADGSARTGVPAVRVIPTDRLLVATGSNSQPPVSARMTAAVLVESLTTTLAARVDVSNCRPGESVELLLPPRVELDSVSAMQSDRTGRLSPMPVPIQRSVKHTRLLLPPEVATDRSILIRATAMTGDRGSERVIPVPEVVVDGVREPAIREVRLIAAVPPQVDVTFPTDEGIAIAPLRDETVAGLLRAVPGAGDLIARPSRSVRLTAGGGAALRTVRLRLDAESGQSVAAIRQRTRFLADRLDWTATIDLTLAQPVWQQEVDVDGRLRIDSVDVIREGVSSLDRWSRSRPSGRRTVRTTLLFEEPVAGSQTITIRGTMPTRPRGPGDVLPLLAIRGVAVASNTMTLENPEGLTVELLDQSRGPWRRDSVREGAAPVGPMLSLDPVVFDAESRDRPTGFRFGRPVEIPELQTAHRIAADGTVDLLAVIAPRTQPLMRAEVGVPPAAEIDSTLYELGRIERPDRIRLQLLAGSGVASGQLSALGLDLARDDEPDRTLSLPDATIYGRGPDVRYLALDRGSPFLPPAGTTVARDSFPDWLAAALGTDDGVTVYRVGGPIELVRSRRTPRPAPRIEHTVWTGPDGVAGRSVLAWDESDAVVAATRRVRLLAALVDNEPADPETLIASALASPSRRIGRRTWTFEDARRVELFWVQSGPSSETPSAGIGLWRPVNSALPTSVSLRVLQPARADVVIRNAMGQTVYAGRDRKPAADFGVVATSDILTPIRPSVRSQAQPGTGYVLAALLIYGVIRFLVPRSTQATLAPELLARYPALVAASLGVLWWLTLAPSELGLVLMLTAVAWAVWRRVVDWRSPAVAST